MPEFFFELVNVDGFILSNGYVKDRQLLDDYEVHEEDVWIAGYPKAGTTWTQEMVWLMVNDLDYEGAKITIQERTPHFEDSVVMNIRPLAKKHGVEIPLFRADSLQFIKENKVEGKPMCIKTHLAFKFLPKQIQNGTKKPKIVYVARNLKDTIVSLHYFLKNLVGFNGTLTDTAQDVLKSEAVYGPQWDHVISYWNERYRSNILILKYEEMVENLPAVLRRVSSFLGKSFTDDQFNKLAEHLSFDKMKNNPAVSFNNLYEMHRKLGMKNDSGAFLRKGKVGSYKEELPPEIIEEFDKLLLEKTKESGFQFI